MAWLVITVQGKDRKYEFLTPVGRKEMRRYLPEWQEQIDIDEAVNVIPAWVAECGLLRPYCWLQDTIWAIKMKLTGNDGARPYSFRDIPVMLDENEILWKEIEYLRNLLVDARVVIQRGVDPMTEEQVSNWSGVRPLFELIPDPEGLENFNEDEQ